MDTLVIGIAGGTGSGKTTVAKNLMSSLPPGTGVRIDEDSYYRDQGHLPLAERERVNYDHPDSLDTDLLATHIAALKAGNPIEKPRYDFVTHTRKAELARVEPCPLILVEGILILAIEGVRDQLDIKIFVDTDSDIRVVRRIRRDIEERGRSFEAIRQQYYRTVRPMHLAFVEPSKRYADMIIPEGGRNTVALDLILGRLFRFLDNGPTILM